MVLIGGIQFLELLVLWEENKRWEEQFGLMSSNKQCSNYFGIHIVPYMIVVIETIMIELKWDMAAQPYNTGMKGSRDTQRYSQNRKCGMKSQ